MWRYLIWMLFLIPQWGWAEVFIGHVTHVTDGDTLWVAPEGSHTPRKLRLQGLDAPELCQTGGEASREALQKLVTGKRLRVTVRYYDTYGRGLARIVVDGLDLGSVLVQSGQAWSSRWHRSLGPYAAQEAQARVARIGVFASSGAELPRDFRKRFGSCHPAR